MVFVLPFASSVGAGRCPAVICAWISGPMALSAILVPVALIGVMVSGATAVPWPIVWPVPPAWPTVLY